MMELRVKGIEKSFAFVPGAITELIVESPTFLYKLLKAFWAYDEENVVVGDGSKIGKTQKELLYIDSFCDLNPNSKSALTALYKNAEKCHMTEMRRQELNEISERISALLFDISIDFNQSTEFDSNIEIGKLMQLMGFKYSNEKEAEFLIDFLTFIKASMDSSNFKFLVTRDLFFFLDSKLINSLAAEMANYGICLIDISACRKKDLPDTINIRVIDRSLCEI